MGLASIARHVHVDVDVHGTCLPPEDARLAYEKSPLEHLRSLHVVWVSALRNEGWAHLLGVALAK